MIAIDIININFKIQKVRQDYYDDHLIIII
jgi:hypothetical protein